MFSVRESVCDPMNGDCALQQWGCSEQGLAETDQRLSLALESCCPVRKPRFFFHSTFRLEEP